MEHYTCALLQDLYRLQQHVLQGIPLHLTQVKNMPDNLFTTLLPLLQPMDLDICYNFTEDICFLMLNFHCPTAKTLKALLNEEDVEETPGTTKKPFTTEAAKNLKLEHPNASMPQLVCLAVKRYSCAIQANNVIWYLPDQNFTAFSPYMHVIVGERAPSFRVGKINQKYCCFTNTNVNVINNGFKQQAEYCGALNMLFPPTIPLSVKYQEYQDTEGNLENVLKTNIYTL